MQSGKEVTFVGVEIDRLEIGVDSSAAKANADLDKLIRRLEKVSDNLTKINGSGLIGFAKGIESLGKSMQMIDSTKTSDFTRLARNIEKIAGVNSAALNRTASSLYTISKSLNTAGAAVKSSENISTLAGNLGKLGGKRVEKAITNLPKLASELKKLMTTLSQSPNVSKNVIQMTNALANLASQLKVTETKSNSTFSSWINRFTMGNKSNRSFAAMAGSFYANAFLIIRGLKKLKSSIEESMDYVETYNYFSVTMDKIGREFGKDFERFGKEAGASTAEEYANSFKDRMNELTRKMTGYNVGSNGELFMTDSIGLGLDPEAIMNYQASISAITNSVGLIGENSVNASKALTMLAADMSSLKNVDLSTVMTNLQSGLIGQSRALYKYGIDITNATLQTYAYKYGLSMAVSEMTQADKMQLRLLAILDQSKVAWGDQANTLKTVANQYRILKQQFSNLARVIGNLFLPIVQKVLPVVNGLVIALQRLFNALGFKLWGGNWLKDIMDGTSGIGGDALGDLADSVDDTADGLKDASKAAEKLKTTVLGIDELNIIRPDDTSGSGTSAGNIGSGIDLSGAISDALEEYEAVWEEAFKNAENKAQEYADRICNAFKSGDYEGIGKYIGGKLISGLDAINWNSTYNSSSNFGKSLAEFYNGLINPELFSKIGRNVAASINTGLYFLNSYGKTFDWREFGGSLSSGLKGFFETWDAGLTGETLSTFAKGLLEAASGALDELSSDKVFKDIGQKIVDFICGIDWGGIVWDLGGFFRSLAKAMAQFPIDLAEGVAQGIADKIFGDGAISVNLKMPKWLSKILSFSNIVNPTSSFTSKVFEGFNFLEGIPELFEDVQNAFSEEWEKIKTWWSETALVQWWEEDVAPWFTIEKWSKLLDNVKKSFKTKWDETAVRWKTDISVWWDNHVEPWFTKERWMALGENLKNGIYEGFKGVTNKVIGVLNDIISALENLINNAISGINELLSKISSSGIGKFVSDFTGFDFRIGNVSFGRIPTFEQGGYPETGQLFLARENGLNEMVGHIGNRPAVANNDQIVESVKYGVRQGVADAVSEILAPYLSDIARNTRETADKDFHVNIGDREISRANDRGRAERGYVLIT